MHKKIQLVICILLIITLSSTLCFDNEEKPEPYKGSWIDLTYFTDLLHMNYQVTMKEESGSDMIVGIKEPHENLFVTIGMDEPYSNLEIEALYNFVENGGTLLVAADDHNNVNPLAKRFGVEYDQYAVINLTFDFNYTFIPLTLEVQSISYMILIHSPLALKVTAPEFELLAQSSGTPESITSAVNVNGNTKIDAEDIPGPIPLIVQVNINDGKAIFISDAGMFTDSLWIVESIDFPGRVYNNQEYISALIDSLFPTEGKIIYDVSKQKVGISNFLIYPPGPIE